MAASVTRLFMAGQAHSALGTAKIITGDVHTVRRSGASIRRRPRDVTPWTTLSESRRCGIARSLRRASSFRTSGAIFSACRRMNSFHSTGHNDFHVSKRALREAALKGGAVERRPGQA